MLRLDAQRPAHFCGGVTRRDFLHAGAIAGLGLSLPGYFAAKAAGDGPDRDVNCIMLFLVGGPSQIDTWDPKPDAPAEIRGPFKAIPTNVPGIRVSEIFPQAQLKQTYGLSELGVLRSNSADRQSLWLRVGGAGFATRIVDNVLHVRSVSNMVGYLNAPNPIDEDGWMNTGDVVEERDGMIRFLGRVSEIINVGGQKVFPAEVESVLLDAPRVIEATVYGRHHPLLGQAVCARVSLEGEEDSESAGYRLRRYCSSRLAKFKVPMHIETIQLASQSNERSKKNRAIRE